MESLCSIHSSTPARPRPWRRFASVPSQLALLFSASNIKCCHPTSTCLNVPTPPRMWFSDAEMPKVQPDGQILIDLGFW